MSKRELVRERGRCARNDRGVARRLQCRSATQRPRRSNPGGVCEGTAVDHIFTNPITGLTSVLDQRRGSRQALPHAMRLDEWSGVVQSVGSIKRYGWFVVIPDGGALEQCDALLSRVPLTTDDRPIAVFRVLESPKRAALMTCNLDSLASGR